MLDLPMQIPASSLAICSTPTHPSKPTSSGKLYLTSPGKESLLKNLDIPPVQSHITLRQSISSISSGKHVPDKGQDFGFFIFDYLATIIRPGTQWALPNMSWKNEPRQTLREVLRNVSR